MRQAAGHFAPGLGSLGGHDFGDVIKHQEPVITRQQRTAHNQRERPRKWCGRLPFCAQLKGTLPVVEMVLGG